MAVKLLSTKPHRAAWREGVSQKVAVHTLMPPRLTSLVFHKWEVRVLCEGDRSGRVDKEGLGDQYP